MALHPRLWLIPFPFPLSSRPSPRDDAESTSDGRLPAAGSLPSPACRSAANPPPL